MEKTIALLGSTGSIGTQTLEVAKKLNIKVDVLAANSNIELLEKQTRLFLPSKVCVFNEEKSREFKKNIKDLNVKVYSGKEGLIEVSQNNNAQIVVTALMGIAGLLPTVAAIKAKKDIALANKETLVCGGDIIINLAEKYGVKILPVDSEHSAIFQCLQGNSQNKIEKIYLTASGGPFFGKDKKYLENVTLKDALNHPNWSMGQKITIDSATLMNKGLEFIEAYFLFKVNPEDIEVVIHRESIIHSMVKYNDKSIIAQMGAPDMKIPISYALTYPNRCDCLSKDVDIFSIGNLTFNKPDLETFGCLKICMEAIRIGKTMPCAVNGANEMAVSLFLQDKIKFLDIENFVYEVFKDHKEIELDVNNPEKSIEIILDTDKYARDLVKKLYEEKYKI